MNKEIIIRNFSRYAYTYDRYADIQQQVASELLGQLKQDGITKILEIGCGTGNFTHLLKDKFKQAEFKAIDISSEMIKVASSKLRDERIKFIVADGEGINLDEEFDLIASNACFQWFNDFSGALTKYRGLLKKNGIILFSIFGPATFQELNESLRHLFRGLSFNMAQTFQAKGLKDILNKVFEEVQVKEAIYVESFPRLRDLLDKIRYTGIRGEGLGAKVFFTPHTLERLEEFYLNKFKRIKTTYQIFLCQALR